MFPAFVEGVVPLVPLGLCNVLFVWITRLVHNSMLLDRGG